ncbi:PP2C family protein-serine/threonine phosphatase [Streptomyces ipomoeae]|uniref:PP2C family protein-serine/threonine phosphatase n=1 Tax=Streptomyces ipomoeae TaxID=103232 RepID=UPI0029BC6E55|nr:PP2C family protein-serine/threonine phosphatase [Streptomyces ipomoeae]MDX2697602.1 PP2C family protein-serine/threonine phosphatase [Streptomyces ipomoeae]MDX2838029.1 PP2C family protein-serine/threonine phosphatase [Streptomyces ipomoeae]
MRTYATAQLIGDRSHQCDATATAAGPDGTRAFVLLDGIGSTDEVRDWTRTAARKLARSAAYHGDAETGLRAQYERYAADPDRQGPWGFGPKACAVVAVATDRWLTVAWCGDTRAYLMVRGTVLRLTADHNLRRVFPPNDIHGGGNRNIVTSCLGNTDTDQDVKNQYGHPAIETTTRHLEDSRLLLASDGAYEPLEDSQRNLADYLTGDPGPTARGFVQAAIDHAGFRADNATVLVADLITTN